MDLSHAQMMNRYDMKKVRPLAKKMFAGLAAALLTNEKKDDTVQG